MFSVDPADEVVNAVIAVLANSPGTPVADLHKRLKAKKVDVTLQHLYRVVGKLVESQVILKRGKTLSLNLLWLSSMELFAQNAREKLLRSPDVVVLEGLKAGGRESFAAQNLDQVQSLWHHVLVQLNTLVPESEERILHKYYSHAYWLAHPKADASFYERIAQKVRCFWLIGSESYLDSEAQAHFKNIFPIAVTDRPPFPEEGYLLNVFGEYCVECVLPKALADSLALLFQGVKSDKDAKPELFLSLFEMRAPCTVTVWKSAKRAGELRAKIEHFMPRNLR